jgi:2-methylisocitrate lyase-like PEP mutase family enzyme
MVEAFIVNNGLLSMRSKEHKVAQFESAQLFRKLHIKGEPIVLINIWDPGSAKAIYEIGAKAIATSSYAVAAAHGYQDGENMPFGLAIGNLERIIASIDIPVTVDLESGYGITSTQVQDTVTKIIIAGAVGINIEDQIIGANSLYSCDEQCSRIAGARKAAIETGVPIFINARTDIFLQSSQEQHEKQLKEALRRAEAYATAGADGFFMPGLQDEALIARLCDISPLPVNIMTSLNGIASYRLAKLGVSRVSYGPAPYLSAIDALKQDFLRNFINQNE